jgi:putative addiction module killer protein
MSIPKGFGSPTTFTIELYQTRGDRAPFQEWWQGFPSRTTVERIFARLARVREGNLGDYRDLGDGVSEFRLQFGPGYRIYFARLSRRNLLLLSAGTKGTQRADIAKARSYYADYLEQHAEADRELPG